MLRWTGAALILAAGLLTRRTLLAGTRSAQRARRELAAALEAMEAEIRALLTPIPPLLRRTRMGEAAGFFTKMDAELTRGASLAEAWRVSAQVLPLPEEERAAFASMGERLDGGEESVRTSLALAASALRQSYDEYERRRGEKERLITSICVCMSLFLALLLL